MVAGGSKDEVLALLRTLKPDLAERYTVNQIGIFGSVVRNEARKDSDIDMKTTLSLDAGALKTFIKESVRKTM